MFVSAAAMRLARFNIQGAAAADKRYFVGMPSPAAASVTAATVYAWPYSLGGYPRAAVAIGVVLVPAILMVTNVRFRSFRSLVNPKSGRPYGLIATAILLVIGFALWPVVTGIVLAYGYLLAPLLLPVVAPLSKLLPAKFKEALS